MPHVERLIVGPFEENAYLLNGPEGVILVDPGDESERILAAVGNRPLAAILITHTHLDHIGALEEVRGRLAPKGEVYGPRAEATFFDDPNGNLSALYGMPLRVRPAERLLGGGERTKIAGAEVEVRFVPGHSPGHLVYLFGGILFAGDTLFAGSIGRSDFPGGDHDLLIEKIRSEIFSLPDATRVLPGHGPETTVGTERRHNPYLA